MSAVIEIKEGDIRYYFDFLEMEGQAVVRQSTSGSGGWTQGLTEKQAHILKVRIQKALVEIGISTTEP